MDVLTEELVREKLVDGIDHELRMSIMEWGLVYEVDIDDGVVKILYTLTTPACPLGPVISGQMENLVMDLPGVNQVTPELTFSPPWDPKTMASDDVKMQLGIW